MARKGRFNKILEFIGLVDDDTDDDLRDEARPQQSQAYQPSNRRTGTSASKRSSGAGSTRDGDRYRTTPARPEQAARRSTAYQPTSRYGQDPSSRSGYTPSRSAGDYTDRYGYGQQRRSSFSADPQRDYAQERTSHRDPIEEEFEQYSSRRDNRGNPEAGDRQRKGNVVSMRQPSTQTMIYYLDQLEECREVINDLLDGKTVLLNLEDMNERIMQRAIDTLCGAAFALGATLRKASDKTYLIAPNSVQVASTRDEERRY